MPTRWNIKEVHDLPGKIENEIRNLFPGMPVTVFTHFEPIEDPSSFRDISIDC